MEYNKIIGDNIKSMENNEHEPHMSHIPFITFSQIFHPKVIQAIHTSRIFDKTDEQSIENSTMIYRRKTLARLKALMNRKIIKVEEIIEDPSNFVFAMNTLHVYDVSLAIKTGVHFGLFGANLLRLGSKKQVGKYIDKINGGQILGALAITELSHGSNVKGINTQATIDKGSNTFVFNTPNIGAIKCWIGNALDCSHILLFAMLCQNDTKILLPFMMRIRKHGVLLDGVRVTEMGNKKGLNGVDNGLISFENFRVGYNSLLDNFGSVDANGDYIYEGDKKEIFNKLLTVLSGGRGVLSYGSTVVAMKALAIAIKYGFARRQFTENLDYPSGTNREIQIIKYSTHYITLMPLLAKSVMFNDVLNKLKQESIKEFQENQKTITKNIHIITSGMKVFCTEHAEKACNVARLLCGGHSYSNYNEISCMHNDIDIFRTFEGDNCVLKQEICKDLLKTFSKKYGLHREIDMVSEYSDMYFSDTRNLLILFKNYRIMLCNRIVQSMANRLANCGAFGVWNANLLNIVNLADVAIYEKICKVYLDNSVATYSTDYIIHLCMYSFVIDNMENFVAFGLLNGKQVGHIRCFYNQYCEMLVQRAREIVDQFGLPKFALDVPMLNRGLLESKL